MNFKTTIVLIVLLAVAAVALFFTREKAGEVAKTAEEKQRLFADLKPEDVTKLVVAQADGKRMVLDKTAGNWRLSEPVNAGAEAFEVDALVRDLVGLQSLGKVQTSGADAAATGLAAPRYTIELTAKDGKPRKLLVGERGAVGDNLYVTTGTGGGSDAHVVATSVLEHLEKPASAYRHPKLIDVPTSEVKQVTLTRGESKIVLTRSGDDWKMTHPTSMPAEKATVDDIVFGLTGLRAVEYVSEDSKDAAYELNAPKLSATLSTAAPTTQAATTGPATQPVEIRFGRYDDVMKKNVYASSSQTPAVAKVAATILDTLNKKPIELRDKRVVDVTPEQVSRIEITSDLKATTQPTSRPASKKTVVLARSKGPTLPVGVAAPAKTQATTGATSAPAVASTQTASTAPSTNPSTTPSSTQASTAPATKPVAASQPATKWEIVAGDARTPADDSKVDQLIAQLHPLRAEKYLENPPATQPTGTYVISVTTEGPGETPVNKHEIRLVDPGDGQPLRGDYNGLAFEANRTLIDRFSGDFTKRAGASASELPDALQNEPFPQSIGP